MDENNTRNKKDNSNENNLRRFLRITNVRSFSNAYNKKLKVNDVIVALNGEFFISSYDDLRKKLDETDENKIVLILRDDVFFNISTTKSLGVSTEEIEENQIKNFDNINLKDFHDYDSDYVEYEIYKNISRNGIVLTTELSILASVAPPLWMLYHRSWEKFSFTLAFLFIMYFVSPWLFCISWVLKSWYYGVNQLNVLRNNYLFKDYRLFLVLTCKDEEEAQKISRALDPKIDFQYSYIEPPLKDNDNPELT